MASLLVDRLRYAFIAATLVWTLRPMMFLLGNGLTGRPAASVLRGGAQGVTARDGWDLTRNGDFLRTTSSGGSGRASGRPRRPVVAGAHAGRRHGRRDRETDARGRPGEGALGADAHGDPD